jgi:MFS family permease
MDTPSNAPRLFTGSCLALVVIGLTFAIRGDIIGDLGTQFNLTHEQLGWIAGAAFWGYVVSIFIAGQLCDLFGMRRLLWMAFLAHVAGVLLTVFAVGFWTLWCGTLTLGIGNALVEAAVNPLIATIYPTQKTQKLNALHAWFPWGIVLGGLFAFLMTRLRFGWQAKMWAIMIPIAGYAFIYLGQSFPATERVQQGLSVSAMYREVFRPRFILLVLCMLLTAATELGPNQWIPNILTSTANFSGILVLVWINGLMATGRMLAGTVARRADPLTVLVVAATLAALGLLALSITTSAAGALAASTVFALGVCYFWPTMLGLTSELFPAGGALLLGIMGGAGNLSVALILPIMGKIYDLDGPRIALRYVAILPAALVGIFVIMWFGQRKLNRNGTVQAVFGMD